MYSCFLKFSLVFLFNVVQCFLGVHASSEAGPSHQEKTKSFGKRINTLFMIHFLFVTYSEFNKTIDNNVISF